ncbi:MAG: hypothetical protein N2235_09220 [Fischerella sp.]|nr:hypothetical protein [Fischerella sp.]
MPGFTTTVAEAIAQYFQEKLPKGEFLAWVAQQMNIYTIPTWRGQRIAQILLQ